MAQTIGYYPEHSGYYDLPRNEPKSFAGVEFEPGEKNTVESGWWEAQCVPLNDIFLMSRQGVLVLVGVSPDETKDDEPSKKKRSPKVTIDEPREPTEQAPI